MNLFNKIVVSVDDSLNPEPAPPADPRHGVPVEEPHPLLHLRDQGRRFLSVASSTIDSETPHTN